MILRLVLLFSLEEKGGRRRRRRRRERAGRGKGANGDDDTERIDLRNDILPLRNPSTHHTT